MNQVRRGERLNSKIYFRQPIPALAPSALNKMSYLPPQIWPGPFRQMASLQAFLFQPYRQSVSASTEVGGQFEMAMPRMESMKISRTRNPLILLLLTALALVIGVWGPSTLILLTILPSNYKLLSTTTYQIYKRSYILQLKHTLHNVTFS